MAFSKIVLGVPHPNRQRRGSKDSRPALPGGQNSDDPSWLTFLGHMKDRLWSIDLFRCESATLRSHWVLVVMDQYTRHIIGFGVHAGTLNGIALCRMFNRAIREQRWMPKYLSSDNDPLYRFHQWQALKDNFQDRGDCQNTRTSATTFVSQNPVRFAGLTGHPGVIVQAQENV